MHDQNQPVRRDRANRGDAETPEAIRHIDALDNLARSAGTVLSVDRDELLGLLHAAECAGAGR